MKSSRWWQRTLILALLSVSVVAPVFLVYHRLNLTPYGKIRKKNLNPLSLDFYVPRALFPFQLTFFSFLLNSVAARREFQEDISSVVSILLLKLGHFILLIYLNLNCFDSVNCVLVEENTS